MALTKLQIKTKALQRLIKEEKYYHVELKEQQDVIEQMKNNPDKDEYDLKKQVEVLEDTRQMIPELRKKINEHLVSLKDFVETYNGDEILHLAIKQIDAAEALLAQDP
ncbi:Rbl2p [Ascoidea rubescens DSM 1968]|uniref:Tubulin-specific chaperone A n=1 Tax=Ascoidea rubescens DSM 1968 TaxID=1344418 RepID=A0A1D2VIU1_9ASCO|nr:tubulin binding cofactor A [Ascoidea rubescens DSM 1968]ODV61548.1 tubulin binding cofactor A [Ascoidea rubescens DSM 1968]